jgi:hypothetical protein
VFPFVFVQFPPSTSDYPPAFITFHHLFCERVISCSRLYLWDVSHVPLLYHYTNLMILYSSANFLSSFPFDITYRMFCKKFSKRNMIQAFDQFLLVKSLQDLQGFTTYRNCFLSLSWHTIVASNCYTLTLI